MKLLLLRTLSVLVMVLSVYPAVQGGEDRPTRCKEICKEYLEHGLEKAMCRPALDMHPRPGVYQSCVMGRVAVFEHTCMPACMAQAGKVYDSYAICKSESKKHNPDAHVSWCRKAYDQTAPEVKQKVTAKIAREFPSSATTDPQDNKVITTSDRNEEDNVIPMSEYKTSDAPESDLTTIGDDDDLLLQSQEKNLVPQTNEETPHLSMESGVSLVRQEPKVEETEAILQPNEYLPEHFFSIENNTVDTMDNENFEQDSMSNEQLDSWIIHVEEDTNIEANISVPDLTNIHLTKDQLDEIRNEGGMEL